MRGGGEGGQHGTGRQHLHAASSGASLQRRFFTHGQGQVGPRKRQKKPLRA